MTKGKPALCGGPLLFATVQGNSSPEATPPGRARAGDAEDEVTLVFSPTS